MKSFVFALLMLFSVTVFITFNAHQTVSYIDEMLTLTEFLPKSEKDFENPSAQFALTVNELTALWEKYFPMISFTAGYENTNRCDEAICALAIHFENENGEDFSVALSEFRDALGRLKILEGFHWQGIF
ncbi:MAG: hypothetical protein E7603_04600 [Ruminococcaceae bacterium]|nr:hypothetical protein [Oscillospiraceae bacterium]